MQLISYLRLATALGILGSAVLTAADSSTFRWRVDAGPSLWLNNRVTFGAYAGAEPSLAARTDRFYDDGYNRVDASNNLGDGAGGLLKYGRDQTIGRLPFTDRGDVLRGEDGRIVNWEDLTQDEQDAMTSQQIRNRKKSRLRGE